MPVQMYFLLGAAGAATVMDISSQKVSNTLIYAVWITGGVWQWWSLGWQGSLLCMAGWALPIVFLYPLFCLRMLGPGDIKLLSALGGIMGPVSIGKCILLSFVFGGILSMGLLIICGNLTSRLRYFAEYSHTIINEKKVQNYYLPGNRPENLHFTVAVFMGIILYAGGVY